MDSPFWCIKRKDYNPELQERKNYAPRELTEEIFFYRHVHNRTSILLYVIKRTHVIKFIVPNAKNRKTTKYVVDTLETSESNKYNLCSKTFLAKQCNCLVVFLFDIKLLRTNVSNIMIYIISFEKKTIHIKSSYLKFHNNVLSCGNI